MPLRVAFDLDGVLADMESELVRQAEVLFGEVMSRRLKEREAAPGEITAGPKDDSKDPSIAVDAGVEAALDTTPPLIKLNMTAGQQRKLWRHVESIENFWETLDEIEPGGVGRLGRLAAERRWEVIFLTKRPETAGRTAQVQTQRWLEAKGFALPSVFVVQGSRGRIASSLALSIVVDDRPENCLDVVIDSKARAILVWREEEKLLPASAHRAGVGVVRSLDECLGILAEIDGAPPNQPGVFDRVLRLLGLKEDSRTA